MARAISSGFASILPSADLIDISQKDAAEIKHFTCRLGLCPGTKITGGKVMSRKTKRCGNRAAQALRLAAAALRSSQSALGAYFWRLCARMGKPKAVTAAAHKLARLIYTMRNKGEQYTVKTMTTTRSATANGSLRQLALWAEKLGIKLVVSEQPALAILLKSITWDVFLDS
jgi:hypothetical protein